MGNYNSSEPSTLKEGELAKIALIDFNIFKFFDSNETME